jgi:hypothetical protein
MKVTKWSTFSGGLNVSEQNAEQQTSGGSGSLNGPAVPNSPDAQGEPVAASAQETPDVDSPQPVSEPGEAPKLDAPKAEAATADATRTPGKIMVMSPGDRRWDSGDAAAEPASEQSQGMFGKRRLSALAAVAVLAAMAGALGGALATAGLGHFIGDDTASTGTRALEASVARIDADILALKASVEHTSKVGMSQFNKTSERLDKVEKAQAEPAAKIAKLSDAVDKLRVAAPATAVAAPAAAKEVTGSISAPAAAPATAPKVEVARLPTVEGWLLRDVANGGALIEGRQGIYEVYAGDPVPGLGRVDAIRRQDGRWVVVTSKGLIVAR